MTRSDDQAVFRFRAGEILVFWPCHLDVATMKTDVAVLQADVATLKTDVATLRTDVAGLKTDMATVKGAVYEILRRLPAA